MRDHWPRESEIAKITASQRTREADIESNKIVAERQISMDKEVREQEILKEQTLESAAVEKAKQVQLAEQERDIVVAEKSRDKSEAEAEADKARALAAKAAEEVITARQAEVEESRQLALREAEEAAEHLEVAQLARARRVAAEHRQRAHVRAVVGRGEQARRGREEGLRDEREPLAAHGRARRVRPAPLRSRERVHRRRVCASPRQTARLASSLRVRGQSQSSIDT